MANFLSKLFGKSKMDQGVEGLLNTALEGIIKMGEFQLSYKIESQGENILVNLTGEDASLLTDKDGLVLDGFQTYLKRLLQNKLPDTKVELIVDCDGYLDSSAQDLKELADKLKQIALDRGQSSFVRALPPRDRKTVHRHLADDGRVKSQSIGEGFYKKIKISPVNMKPRRRPNKHRSRPQGNRPMLSDDDRGNVLQHDESLEN